MFSVFIWIVVGCYAALRWNIGDGPLEDLEQGPALGTPSLRRPVAVMEADSDTRDLVCSSR